VRGGRDRIADPDEAAALLAALPQEDRPRCATALYAGLRRGELMALHWEDVALDGGRLEVARSWDMVEGPIAPKSVEGRRAVPIASVVRTLLVEHRLRTGGSGLVFGVGHQAFRPDVIRYHASTTWHQAGLAPITLHECRHTFASLMIATGVNAKALSTYMGHANIAITLGRYGHLMPGSEADGHCCQDAAHPRGADHSAAASAPPRSYIEALLRLPTRIAVSLTLDALTETPNGLQLRSATNEAMDEWTTLKARACA
jgi:integrase